MFLFRRSKLVYLYFFFRVLQQLLKVLLVLDEKNLHLKEEKYGNLFTYETYFDKNIDTNMILLNYSSIFPISSFIQVFYEVFTYVREIAEKEEDVKQQILILSNFFIKYRQEIREESLKMAISLALPYMNDPKWNASAIWELFNPTASCMMKHEIDEYLLKPIEKLYENSVTSPKHMKLYHRVFIVQLIVRIGLEKFLNTFAKSLVKAVTGQRNFEEDLDLSHDNVENSEKNSKPTDDQDVFEVNLDENVQDEGTDQLNTSKGGEEKENRSKSNCSFSNIKCNISDAATETMQWMAHRLGPVLTSKYITRNLLAMLSGCYYSHLIENISDSNVEHLGRRLLGDEAASRVSSCLIDIAVLYGEQVIILQYYSYFIELVKLACEKLTLRNQSAVIASVTLLQYTIPYLSDTILMENLDSIFLNEFLIPCIKLVTSETIQFPSSYHGRQALGYRLVDVLYTISIRIGFDLTRKKLTSAIKLFFDGFSKERKGRKSGNRKCHTRTSSGVSIASCLEMLNNPIEEETVDNFSFEESCQELEDTFNKELAFYSYIPLCRQAGDFHFESILTNNDFLRGLCAEFEEQESLNRMTLPVPVKVKEGSTMGTNVSVIGNQISVQHSDISSDLNTAKQNEQMILNNQRHLKGNWLAYWEKEIGFHEESAVYSDFHQIKLQNFEGHKNYVKDLCILDNENSLLSASKDKTVKIWSVRNTGNGNSRTFPQFTYTRHNKSVFAVSFLSSSLRALSCDGVIHEWDPFMGVNIRTFMAQQNVVVIKKFPEPSNCLMSATADGKLRLVDIRSPKGFTYQLRSSLTSNTSVRCLDISPNGKCVAVGQSNGYLSILDVRTGLVSGILKAHDSEILKVKSIPHLTDQTVFVTSSSDSNVYLWKADSCKVIGSLKSLTEPVHCVEFFRKQLICSTTTNKICFQTQPLNYKSMINCTTVKLQHDIIKGQLTAFKVLPLNRMLLVANDHGLITLVS